MSLTTPKMKVSNDPILLYLIWEEKITELKKSHFLEQKKSKKPVPSIL